MADLLRPIKQELGTLRNKIKAHGVSKPENVVVDLIFEVGNTTYKNGKWSVLPNADAFYLTLENIVKFLDPNNLTFDIKKKDELVVHSSRLVLDEDNTLPKYEREIAKAEVVVQVKERIKQLKQEEDIDISILRQKGYIGVIEWKTRAIASLGSSTLDQHIRKLAEGKVSLSTIILEEDQ